MKYIYLKKQGERILYEKLDNGLDVYILRKKDYNTSTARLYTDFGARDIEFIPYNKDKMVKMPTGIAHFLEHKLFEQEEGLSVHEFYKKTGSIVNAFTNYDKTCYYFSCVDNFKENLNFLLDFVQSPYFTDENVEKEKGIIKEEALMNMDEIGRIFLLKILKNLFTDLPYDNPVVGSLDDIQKITKEDLYECYNTFYHPSNMHLIIVTNYDEEEVLSVVKENQKKKNFNKAKKIVRKEYNETEKVRKEYEEIEENNLKQKQINYSVKIPKKNFESEDIEIVDSFMILFSNLIGALSDFNLDLKKKKIISSNISYSVEVINAKEDYVVIYISTSTNKEKEFIKLLEDRLKDISIKEEDFNSLKKVMISSLFYNLNTVQGSMNLLYNVCVNYNGLFSETLHLHQNLTYEKFKKIIKRFNTKNKLVVILKPSVKNK